MKLGGGGDLSEVRDSAEQAYRVRMAIGFMVEDKKEKVTSPHP